MSTDQQTMRLKDLARAAALVAQAADSAEPRAIRTVSTPYGEADVILDRHAADVVLPDRDVTIHVRGLRGGNDET